MIEEKIPAENNENLVMQSLVKTSRSLLHDFEKVGVGYKFQPHRELLFQTNNGIFQWVIWKK